MLCNKPLSLSLSSFTYLQIIVKLLIRYLLSVISSIYLSQKNSSKNLLSPYLKHFDYSFEKSYQFFLIPSTFKMFIQDKLNGSMGDIEQVRCKTLEAKNKWDLNELCEQKILILPTQTVLPALKIQWLYSIHKTI